MSTDFETGLGLWNYSEGWTQHRSARAQVPRLAAPRPQPEQRTGCGPLAATGGSSSPHLVTAPPPTHPLPTPALSPGYFLVSAAEPGPFAVLYSPEFQASGPCSCSVRQAGGGHRTSRPGHWDPGASPDLPPSLPSSSSTTTCTGLRPASSSWTCRLRALGLPEPLSCCAGAMGSWVPPGFETAWTSRAGTPSR